MKKLIVFILLFFSVTSKAQESHWYVAAKMSDNHNLWDGSSTNIWAFGPYNPTGPIRTTLPGPILRANYNDSVFLHFYNLSPEDHTIHLHGLDVNQANDGVPTTSFPVTPNDSTLYVFDANHSGTYLYHCHVLTTLHLTMGMYGLLIIDYPGMKLWQNGPGFNKERAYLLSDLDKNINDNPISPGPLNEHDPNYFMVNGLSKQDLLADTSQVVFANSGDSILLRMANVSYNHAVLRFPSGCNPTVYMSDGRKIPTPFNTDTLLIHSGERYDIICKPSTYFIDSIQVDYYDQITGSLDESNAIFWNMSPDALYEKEQSTISEVFPNPASSSIYLTSSKSQPLRIYSSTGQLVHTSYLQSGLNEVNIETLLPGVYFIQSELFSPTLKFIKY